MDIQPNLRLHLLLEIQPDTTPEQRAKYDFDITHELTAGINNQNSDGDTPIMLAYKRGYTNIFRKLANNPCINLNLKNKSDETILSLVCGCADYENVEQLCSAGAEITPAMTIKYCEIIVNCHNNIISQNRQEIARLNVEMNNVKTELNEIRDIIEELELMPPTILQPQALCANYICSVCKEKN
jgi:ankyrin repeat protein